MALILLILLILLLAFSGHVAWAIGICVAILALILITG